MNTDFIVSIPGIGSVIIDATNGTLKPSTHVVAQRLCVGFRPDTTDRADRNRSRIRSIEQEATDRYGMPETGWQWLDHDGMPTSIVPL